MALTLSGLFSALSLSGRQEQRLVCYHCDETMRQSQALYVSFNGDTRAVCCHGCLAILKTIERNRMVDDYLQTKAMQQEPS